MSARARSALLRCAALLCACGGASDAVDEGTPDDLHVAAYDPSVGDQAAYNNIDASDAAQLPVKSLREFGAACDGVTNDRDAVASAFAAAANNAFELQVDATCSAYIKVGMDITQPIFFDDETTVRVLPGGKLILESTGNTIENVTATYDSTFCGDQGPAVRFPGTPYASLTITGLSVRDTASSTDHAIFLGSPNVTSGNVSGVSVTMNHWAGTGDYVATFAGTTNNALIAYSAVNDLQVKSAGEKDAVAFELAAQP